MVNMNYSIEEGIMAPCKHWAGLGWELYLWYLCTLPTGKLPPEF
uniref:Uncharacterized protein n=1 Tax=Arundo donax TaxID=35708 RepID=A0A0A9EAA2_ARUDO